jgi:hypothetical protein
VQTTAKLDACRWEIILASASAHLNGKDIRFDAVDEESCNTLDEDNHGYSGIF